MFQQFLLPYDSCWAAQAWRHEWWRSSKYWYLVMSPLSKSTRWKKNPLTLWLHAEWRHMRITCQYGVLSPDAASLRLSWTSAWLFFFFQQGIYGHETKTLCSTLSLPSLFSPTALGRYKKLSFILPPELHYSARLWLGTSSVLSFLLK